MTKKLMLLFTLVIFMLSSTFAFEASVDYEVPKDNINASLNISADKKFNWEIYADINVSNILMSGSSTHKKAFVRVSFIEDGNYTLKMTQGPNTQLHNFRLENFDVDNLTTIDAYFDWDGTLSRIGSINLEGLEDPTVGYTYNILNSSGIVVQSGVLFNGTNVSNSTTLEINVAYDEAHDYSIRLDNEFEENTLEFTITNLDEFDRAEYFFPENNNGNNTLVNVSYVNTGVDSTANFSIIRYWGPFSEFSEIVYEVNDASCSNICNFIFDLDLNSSSNHYSTDVKLIDDLGVYFSGFSRPFYY